MRRWMFKTWSMALTAAAVGSAAAVEARGAAPAVAPRVTETAPAETSPAEERALKPAYTNVPADTILNDVAADFGLIILKPEDFSARVSVRIDPDASAAEAIAVLKQSLIPRGYSLQPGDAVGRIWQVVPATQREQEAVAAARRAGEAPEAPATRTMKFRFEDTPIESILDDITQKLGIEIDRAQPVPGRISVYVPNPVNAEEALRLLNALLAPSNYTAIEIERYNTDGTPRLAVRVWPIDEAKKGGTPVE